MNRKSIDQLTNLQGYNTLLFQSAVQQVQQVRKLLLLPSAQSAKRQALQNALKSAILTIGKFLPLPKQSTATTLDHAEQIFEALTDLIETSVNKAREAKKNPIKEQITHLPQRPQDIYPFIKPANFRFHEQQKNLEYIRVDTELEVARNLEGSAIWVGTTAELDMMIFELSKQREIAVDLQHSARSYEGFTCLIQVSSRKKDYIVDVLPLWREIPKLKRILEDQRIIKVMHGADSDTIWLQRDFDIHLTTLFDTYRAARVLGHPKLSYAYLLQHYCRVSTDKTYQTADWRQRPLPPLMIHYARLDTHFLLEIFDRIRQDLHNRALSLHLDPRQVIEDVYATSFEVTKTQVQLFDFRNRESFQALRRDSRREDLQVFERVFGVFDDAARKLDVSFEELVSKKVEQEAIARIRELLYHRRSRNSRWRIDRVIAALRDRTSDSHLQGVLPTVKAQLELLLGEEHKPVVVRRAEPNKIIQEVNILAPQTNRQHFRVNLSQHPLKSYENSNMNPFSMLVFEPIAKFLSVKLGVIPKAQQKQDEMQGQGEQGSEEEILQEQGDEAEQVVQEMIEMKRLNPNVIYTVEQAEIEAKARPRKIRKQLEYEDRLRNKQGNIYELLED